MARTIQCGKSGCSAPAEFRGRLTSPDERVARCSNHTGHHLFTERLVDGEWTEWHDAENLCCDLSNGRRYYNRVTLKDLCPDPELSPEEAERPWTEWLESEEGKALEAQLGPERIA